MPRKSTGGVSASGASTPNTPVTKSGPRKSLNGTSSGATAGADSEPLLTIPPSTKLVLKQQEVALKGIESFELPRSNIVKCAKTDIPDTVQLRKEVQSALVKSASVFISYLTATAHDNARKKKGKVISPQHVLDAMKELGFADEDEVVASMKAELRAFRDNVARKKTEKTAVEKKTDGAEEAEGGNDADVSRFDGDEADESRLADETVGEDEDQLMDED